MVPLNDQNRAMIDVCITIVYSRQTYISRFDPLSKGKIDKVETKSYLKEVFDNQHDTQSNTNKDGPHTKKTLDI